MKKELTIVVLCLVGAVLVAAFWGGYRDAKQMGQVTTNDHPTHGAIYFDDELVPADPLIVGRWVNCDNPKWHKVYYDDYDEEQCFYWGKEWDESEDIYEEDLDYHGNGWFHWDKRDDIFREFATMSVRNVPIRREYQITLSTQDSLIYREPEHENVVFRFVKINN